MFRKSQGVALFTSAASALILSAGAMAADQSPQMLPPDAKPGECFARVLLPAQYVSESTQMLKRDAAEEMRVTPARYETVTEQVMVRESSSRLEVVPAVYEAATEQVLVRPASKKLVEVPAVYRSVTEQVLESPAQTIWKSGGIAANSNGRILQTATSGETGEVLCLVEIPAKYKTVTRTVLDTPAMTREVELPAEYTTVAKRVLKTPTTTREITIPAEYKTVQVTKLVQPARSEAIALPAEYQAFTSSKLVREPAMQWRQVLCDQNMTDANIVAMQRELKGSGYYKGPLDGVIGPRTMGAVNAFANAQSLPTGNNFIAVDVAKELGISL